MQIQSINNYQNQPKQQSFGVLREIPSGVKGFFDRIELDKTVINKIKTTQAKNTIADIIASIYSNVFEIKVFNNKTRRYKLVSTILTDDSQSGKTIQEKVLQALNKANKKALMEQNKTQY